MRLGFFVSELESEKPQYMTYKMAWAAHQRQHEIYHLSASDFTVRSDDSIILETRKVRSKSYKNPAAYFDALFGQGGRSESIDVSDLDALMLRSDPSLSQGDLIWRQTLGIQLGLLAQRKGVLVLNSPLHLLQAMDKMYLQLFPESIRPRSIITRSLKAVKEFAADLDDHIILKPLQGSSGKGVFIVEKGRQKNLKQIVESLVSHGYLIAQEYLPAAKDGDTRLFLIDGKPLEKKGKYAAFRRIRKGEDLRSNVHVGGKIARAKITDQILDIAEKARPRLILDGMFMVGLDIVGDKILEVNVFCPGGLGNAQKLEGIDFATMIIERLENKIKTYRYYKDRWYNVEAITL